MVTFTLIGINVVMYVLGLMVDLNTTGVLDELTPWERAMWLVPAHSGWYAYITTMFVHDGFFHLLGNMVYLFLFGSPVEDIIGRWYFLAFYLLGGLASSFAHIAFVPGHFASEIALGGASGAVSACLGGFVVLLAKTQIEFKYLVFLFFHFSTGEFFLPAWLVLSFWFLWDLLFAMLSLAVEGAGGGVAFGAHVGGFAIGLGMISLYKLLKPKEQAETDLVEEEIPSVSEPEEVPTLYISESGNQLGPFTLAQISEMLTLGSISQDAFYWQEGMSEWQSVREILTKEN